MKRRGQVFTTDGETPGRTAAERGGFEPTVPLSEDTAFPVLHNRPLCHLSGNRARRGAGRGPLQPDATYSSFFSFFSLGAFSLAAVTAFSLGGPPAAFSLGAFSF